MYDLFSYKNKAKKEATGQRITDKDINKKEVKFTSVVNVPGRPYEVVAVGSDKAFTSNAPIKKGQKELYPEELPLVLSQIQITPNGRTILAGVGEPDRPGAIQVWSRFEDKPLDKLNEIQAHSRGVERLRLSPDTQNLFSVG